MSETLRTRVLLVEDEQADIDFTKYAFEGGELDHDITVVQSGRCALEVLSSVAGTNEFPQLALVDMNLPDVTGIDLLKQIRSDPVFAHLPVILLSTSNYDQDVSAAYRSFANAYVQKPLRLSGFEDLVTSIEQFWFGQATLPPN